MTSRNRSTRKSRSRLLLPEAPPDDGRSVTEAIRDADTAQDAAVVIFDGRAQGGFDPGFIDEVARAVAGKLARAHVKQTGRNTSPLAALRAQPTFTPLSAPVPDLAPPPGPQSSQLPPPPQSPLDAPRNPRPPRAQREPDLALIALTPAGPVLECGLCPRTDPGTGKRLAPETHADFRVMAAAARPLDALRGSAWRAGWRLDLFGNWCCPFCQGTARYHAAREFTHYHPDAHQNRGRVTETLGGGRDAEFWLEVISEEAAAEEVMDASRRGHAMLYRPDGRCVTAVICGPRHRGGEERPSRHRSAS